MPTLRVGDLLRDHELMEEARREAVAALDGRQADDARRARALELGAAFRPGRSRVAWAGTAYSGRAAVTSVAIRRSRMRIIAGTLKGRRLEHARLGRAAADVRQAARDAVQRPRRRALPARACSTATPAPARSASRRSAAARRTSPSSSSDRARGRPDRGEPARTAASTEGYAIIRAEFARVGHAARARTRVRHHLARSAVRCGGNGRRRSTRPPASRRPRHAGRRRARASAIRRRRRRAAWC